MFDWLEKEIADIKTRKFHIVDGPAGEMLQQAVTNCSLTLPESYMEFVLRFGNAKLYKELNYYKIGVLGSPRKEIDKDGQAVFYCIGHYDSNKAYFKESLLKEGEETPVYESGEDGMHNVADSFLAWLTKRCKAAREKYNKSQWAEIVAGPPPFGPDEYKIIEARHKYRWSVVGLSINGDIQFKVYNGSDLVLPFLTIGIRGKRCDNGSILEGKVWLSVGAVLPGETAVIAKECYKKWVAPQDIMAFEVSAPDPEDRKQYWEFKSLAK